MFMFYVADKLNTTTMPMGLYVLKSGMAVLKL